MNVAIALSMIAVVIAVIGVVYHITSAKRSEKAITAFVVAETSKALNGWAQSFEVSAENVIKMIVDEKLAAANAPKTKAAAKK